MELDVADRLATLGHPKRLAVFRVLMRRHPDAVPATELARAIDVKPNTLSTYVAALKQAGLLTQERIGTSLRYGLDLEAVRATFDYLLLDCCRGRPEVCSPLSEQSAIRERPAAKDKYNVLFICTGNSARSIMAETLLRDLAGERFDVYSAGTKPRSELNPLAIEVLQQKGHDTSGLKAENVAVYRHDEALTFDFVFTVCNRAANEDCPAWPGQPVSAHWGMPDPVKVEGSEAERSLAFQQAYGALRNRIAAFAALPVAALDRMSLQQAVDAIGQIEEGDEA